MLPNEQSSVRSNSGNGTSAERGVNSDGDASTASVTKQNADSGQLRRSQRSKKMPAYLSEYKVS